MPSITSTQFIHHIPTFPTFKKLELEDQEEIVSFLQNYLPYSDFNFTSLWSYNTNNDFTVSWLNNNLVVKFTNYFTEKPFFSFIGNTDIIPTIQMLISEAEKQQIDTSLRLIPESVIATNPEILNKFATEEDRNDFDYIYSLHKLNLLQGHEYEGKRNKISHFSRSYPTAEAKTINPITEDTTKKLLEIFAIWSKNKHQTKKSSRHEYTALKRLLKNEKKFKLVVTALYDNEKLIAFSIAEKLLNHYAIMHFAKADIRYKGIFEYLFKKTAEKLIQQECVYLSREQDLGIEPLRVAKESWKPILFLKKYTISAKKQ